MRRETVPQAVTVCAFHDSGGVHCFFDGALQNSFGNMMSLSFAAARIDGNARGRENILPCPFTRGAGKFSTQSKRKMYGTESVFDILVMLRLHAQKMASQWFR